MARREIAEMDYGRILQRAFTITLRHKALWVFGIASALFEVVAQTPRLLQFTLSGPDFRQLEGAWPPLFVIDWWVYAVAAAVSFVLVLLGVLVRLISRAAILGMVRDVESMDRTDLSSGLSYGLRNWLRLLAIYLVVWVPFILLFLILFAFALSPLLLLLGDDQTAKVLGVAAAITLGAVTLGVLIIASIVLSIAQQFIDRSCVLRGKGVFQSIADGFRVMRRNLGQSLLLWLIMLGVGFIIGVLVFALLVLLAATVGIPVVIAWQVSTPLAIALGIALGLPALLIFTFFSALANIYTSAAWTLAYLQLAAVEG